MKLGIVSWNIRHLRPEKVADYVDYIFPRLVHGRMLLLYENKISNNENDELCKLLAKELSKEINSKDVEFEWVAVPVGTNENVIVCWMRYCKTGKNSTTPDTWISIKVKPNYSFQAKLLEVGKKAVESSLNETVMANVQSGRAHFRVPAILDVTIGKHGGKSTSLRVAAWHAPGPATGLPSLLWREFQKVLLDDVDLYVGDFNMTGLSEQTRQPLVLHRTGQSTTITEGGPVNHQEGLDLVYRNTVRLGDASSGVNTSSNLVGRVRVSVLPPGNDYKKAFAVSDHLPVYIEVKGL